MVLEPLGWGGLKNSWSPGEQPRLLCNYLKIHFSLKYIPKPQCVSSGSVPLLLNRYIFDHQDPVLKPDPSSYTLQRDMGPLLDRRWRPTLKTQQDLHTMSYFLARETQWSRGTEEPLDCFRCGPCFPSTVSFPSTGISKQTDAGLRRLGPDQQLRVPMTPAWLRCDRGLAGKITGEASEPRRGRLEAEAGREGQGSAYRH